MSEPAATVADATLLFAPQPLTDFVDGKLPEPRWAVRGMWPERASGIIGGRPKDKKSSIAVELAVSLATRTPMFNLPQFPVEVEPAPVLYIQQENANTRVQRDFQKIMCARQLGTFNTERIPTAADADGNEIAWDELIDFTPTLDTHPVFWSRDVPRFEILSHAGFDLSNADHRDWLTTYVKHYGFQYVFLDPLYQLIGGVDEKDSAPLKPLFLYLTRLKNECNCATIVTHHMSDKGKPNEAASLLGSTYIHGWYEAAIFTRSTQDHLVSLSIDAQRDIGVSETYTLQGRGVGHWDYDEAAQNRTDSLGRSSPQHSQSAYRRQHFMVLWGEHGDTWDDEKYGNAVGVSGRTIRTYKQDVTPS